MSGGTQTSMSFQVGSSLQGNDVADVRILRFDSDAEAALQSVPSRQLTAPSAMESDEVAKSSLPVTIPAGTRISVRTIDSSDSSTNQVGYRFQASLEETSMGRWQCGSSEGARTFMAGWKGPNNPELLGWYLLCDLCCSLVTQ